MTVAGAARWVAIQLRTAKRECAIAGLRPSNGKVKRAQGRGGGREVAATLPLLPWLGPLAWPLWSTPLHAVAAQF